MNEIKELEQKYGLELPKFDRLAVTIQGDVEKLSRAIERRGYRLAGIKYGGVDRHQFIVTREDGTYQYCGMAALDPIPYYKWVNYKDLVGDQITTVDFVQGYGFGLITCLVIWLIKCAFF